MSEHSTKPPRKITLAALREELGLSPDDMTRAKKAGINPYDREAMKQWKSDRNSYVRRDLPIELPEDDGKRMTIEEIEDCASRPGLSKKETDVLKGQLEVMRAADALRVQRNKLLSRDECKESMTKIGSALAAFIARSIIDIPTVCEGLPRSKSAPLVKGKMRELQAMFADFESEFWKDHPEKE
jgi:hypothetical protein